MAFQIEFVTFVNWYQYIIMYNLEHPYNVIAFQIQHVTFANVYSQTCLIHNYMYMVNLYTGSYVAISHSIQSYIKRVLKMLLSEPLVS